jgi:hypothetical protein
MADLVLGPLLRYVGKTEATVWVETDEACEVEILGSSERTFCVNGHHFALVVIDDLEPGETREYEVALDGERSWPPQDYEFPPPVLRTFRAEEQIEIVFGSCRVALPQEPPYTKPKEVDSDGRGFDALHALAVEILDAQDPSYPDLLFLLGDQVYADEVSPQTQEFIDGRDDRPPEAPPDQVADFEEYTRLYRESWSDPVIRWLLSTVSTSMVIDDHDMHDDWNISEAWCEQMERMSWWRPRVIGGMTAYWIYQFIGNLSPGELAERRLYQRVLDNRDDAGAVLTEYMEQDDREREGKRWSFYRDLGTTRLIVIDVRTGRCLDPGERKIVDDDEWDWITERAGEDEFDHLLLGTSDPYLLSRAFHNLESWNEKVCDGAWGGLAARWAEKMRQELDFDHWGAFEDSFLRLTRLIEEVGRGASRPAPATIGVLSGDVHHAYFADVAFRREAGVESVVYQGVCSPYRNALNTRERRAIELARTRPIEELTLKLARSVGVRDPGIRWRFAEGPYYDNQVATLKLEGRSSSMKLEKVPRDPEGRDERLELLFERQIS